SNGIKELALKGLGVAWLPVSMTHQEIENGELVSLSGCYGSLPLNIVLYADIQDDTARTLLDVWST
ncbi:MAG: LysR family transcriptional regulator, partial [Anderseniella sp.]|nr:LysR family transcriptional regulator [Anderseniella sp.]